MDARRRVDGLQTELYRDKNSREKTYTARVHDAIDTCTVSIPSSRKLAASCPLGHFMLTNKPNFAEFQKTSPYLFF